MTKCPKIYKLKVAFSRSFGKAEKLIFLDPIKNRIHTLSTKTDYRVFKHFNFQGRKMGSQEIPGKNGWAQGSWSLQTSEPRSFSNQKLPKISRNRVCKCPTKG